MIIYTPGPGLGDNWYAINKLLRTEEQSILISRYCRPEHAYRTDCKDRLLEILPLLDTPTNRIKIVDQIPTNFKTGFYKLPWDAPYYRTHKKWIGGEIITYQFDGNHFKRVNGLPNFQLLESILDTLETKYDVIKLGKHLSLKENIELLAKSKCFLGVSSGMMHVAHSVGVPCGLIEGKLPCEDYHRNKTYKLLRSFNDIISFTEGLE